MCALYSCRWRAASVCSCKGVVVNSTCLHTEPFTSSLPALAASQPASQPERQPTQLLVGFIDFYFRSLAAKRTPAFLCVFVGTPPSSKH